VDYEFTIYQKRIELWHLMLNEWKFDITTFKYWSLITVILVSYIIWYRFIDKKHLLNLLLFGSFFAVMRVITDLAGVTAGLWYFKTNILPLGPSLFIHDLTISPLTYMLVQQYSSNWQRFFMWNFLGAGFIYAVALPLLSTFDILHMMHWNYLYGFIIMYVTAILARGVLNLVVKVQHKACEGKDDSLINLMLQPTLKPITRKEEEDK
jgi:hypothetical protein